MSSAVVSSRAFSASWLERRFRSSLSMVRCLRLLIPLLVVVAWTSNAQAYAWMIRYGYTKCATCHTDPSGGELLNHMGRVQSEKVLSADWGNGGALTTDSKLLYALDEPDRFRIGGSARYMGIYDLDASDLRHFPMQMDAYAQGDFGVLKVGGSIGYASIPQNSPHLRAAQLLTDDGEGGANVISRSHWIGADLGEHWLVRGGRLNLPFGIRTSEHVLYVRDSTKTDRESDQQHGLALSYSGGRWRGEGMFVLGNYQVSPDDFRERGFVGFGEYALDSHTAVGINSLVLQSGKSLLTGRQERTLRHAHGATLRWSPITPFVLMGEVDVLKTSGSGMGYTVFLNGDYELLKGLHLSVTGEAVDAGKPDKLDTGFPGAGEMIYAAWASAQWFFYTHWDFRLDAIVRKDSPTNVQAQVHFYF